MLRMFFFFVFVLAGCSILYVYSNVWISSNETEDLLVVKSIRSTLFDELKTKVSGGYVDDAMMKKTVRSLSTTQRLEFFRLFIQHSDSLEKSGEMATIFSMDIVADDRESLQSYLKGFKRTSKFQELPVNQQKRLNNWIETLEVSR